MPEPSSPPRLHKAFFDVSRRRLLLGLSALSLITYFTYLYAFAVPFDSVFIRWQPGGSAVIVEVPQPIETAPGQPTAQVGDTLLAIDGIPLRLSDLRFRFGPPSPSHLYELQRGPEEFSVAIPSGTPTTRELFNLLLPGIVAVEAWLLGFIIVLLAPPGDRDVWLVGYVMLGSAIALAAAPAGGVGIPGARLAYEVLTPIMSVGYLEMAFLPREQSQRSRAFIRVAYVAASVLSGLALIEIFVLNPRSSWELLTGIRLHGLVLAFLALSILATPLVMIYRALRHPATYTRRQIIILLAGTSVVLLPFIFLTAIPLAISGKTLLPVEVTVPLLGAIPATYAYVIYRHRYLRLDLFAGRTIMLLLAALAISIFFFAGLRLAQSLQQTAPLAPLVGMVSLFVGIGMVGKASGRLQSAVDLLLFGPDRHFDQALKGFTGELLANPQSITLGTILLERLPEVLDIRQAALLLRDGEEKLVPFSTTNTDDLPMLNPELLSGLNDAVLHQVQPGAPIFQAVPWARLAVPLQVKGATTGLLLLGRKIPEARFDSQEVEFLQKVAATAAVAGDNIQLFESLQLMAQDRLRMRSAERKQLAYRLHDEPLKRTYTIAQQLEQLSSALPADHPFVQVLKAQREEVRTLQRELRDICSGLRPAILNQGFQLTLRDVIGSFQAVNPDVTLELAVAGDEEPAISDDALESVYHVITEALNNVSRHSRATHVRITVENVQGSLRICITDNGCGMRVAQLSQPELARSHHFGIVGMFHWAKIVDGRLRMYPAAQQGTVVELLVPCKPFGVDDYA